MSQIHSCLSRLNALDKRLRLLAQKKLSVTLCLHRALPATRMFCKVGYIGKGLECAGQGVPVSGVPVPDPTDSESVAESSSADSMASAEEIVAAAVSSTRHPPVPAPSPHPRQTRSVTWGASTITMEI